MLNCSEADESRRLRSTVGRFREQRSVCLLRSPNRVRSDRQRASVAPSDETLAGALSFASLLLHTCRLGMSDCWFAITLGYNLALNVSRYEGVVVRMKLKLEVCNNFLVTRILRLFLHPSTR